MSWEMKERLDSKLAKEANGLKFVVAPANVTFVIKVDFDKKVEKAAMADPLLRKDFDDAGQDTIERFVEFVGLKMKSTNQQVNKLVDQNKLDEAEAMKAKMNRDIEQMRGSAQQFGVQQVQRAWTDLGQKKKEYRTYKIKIVVTISAASAGLATSIGLLAATGFSWRCKRGPWHRRDGQFGSHHLQRSRGGRDGSGTRRGVSPFATQGGRGHFEGEHSGRPCQRNRRGCVAEVPWHVAAKHQGLRRLDGQV